MISHIAPSTIQQIDPITRALSSLSASSLASLVAKNDELVRTELEAFRTIFFVCLVAATVMVFVGVAFEEGEELMHAVKRILPLDPMTVYRWAKKLTRAGWILIVIGVAGEGIFEVYVARVDGILSRFEDILLTDARREAADAVLAAATANVQIADARQQTALLKRDAAELEKKAQDEALARVKIEASVAWRRLNDTQKKDIGAQLTRFGEPNRVAFLWYSQGDVEGLSFGVDIAQAIRKGGIKAGAPGAIGMMNGTGRFDDPITRPETGIWVYPTPDPIAQDMAATLVKELSDRGFDAVLKPPQPPQKRSDPRLARMDVWIGARPEGPQGEYKLQAERDAKAKNKARISK